MVAASRFMPGLTAVICVFVASLTADITKVAGEEFDKLDINQDGRLSGTEFSEQLRPLDANGDGRVTREEYEAGMSGASKEAAEKEFNERDINRDGVLSGTEARGVEKFDADGDGELSKEEFLSSNLKPKASREALFRQVRGKYGELDSSKNGLLSGTEIETVAQHDLNSDGRITLDEFFEAHERAAGLGWKTFELADGKITATLPAAPQAIAAGGPLKHRFALEITEPAIRFEVRISELGSDVETKAEEFFTILRDRLKTGSKMDIADEDDAPHGKHPGRTLLMQGPQNDFHAVRIVLLGKQIYELEMIFTKEPGDLEEAYGRRFLERVTIADAGNPSSDTAVPPAPFSLPSGPGAVPPAPSVAPPAPVDVPAPPAFPDDDDRGRTPLRRLPGLGLPGAPAPTDSSGPAAPRSSRNLFVSPLSPRTSDSRTAAAGPPNGTYTLQKISGSSFIGLGTLELRDGTYRCGDEGDFQPFTVDADGKINWSAGLNFLPDGWTHDYTTAGRDGSGRPMLKIYYRSARGTRDVIDGIVE